jgi:capsular polysaccharide biosynthesis protein
MELRDYLSILWRRKWLIIFTVAIAVGVAATVSWLIKPQYLATVTIRISTARSGSAGYSQYNLDYSDRLMNTYANIITSRPLVIRLQQELHFSSIPPVGVAIIANTELMQVSVTAASPAAAAKAANTLAGLLINVFEQDQRSGILAGGGTDAISIVAPAVAPQSPAAPRKTLNLALGFVLGLVAGAGLAVLFEHVLVDPAPAVRRPSTPQHSRVREVLTED